MNKIMKAYTDLEQSKRLLEILPLESADMYYDYDVQKHEYYPMFMDDQFDDLCIRAWSLAKLLSVLPNYQLQTQDDGIGILCSCNGKFNIFTADNSVDACVIMIEKLHEQKLL